MTVAKPSTTAVYRFETSANALDRPLTDRPRIRALDGLRGLAILLVLVTHFGDKPGQNLVGTGAVLRAVASVGWCGVDLFFVLSGFLITGILLDTKDSVGYFRCFYGRRLLRIFPLYYGVLFFMVIIFPRLHPPHSGSMQYVIEHQRWLWLYANNLAIFFLPDCKFQFSAVGHFWSLAVEEQFYLLWPAAVFLLSLRLLIRACYAVCGVALLLRIIFSAAHIKGIYFFTPCRFDALMIGALIACVCRSASVPGQPSGGLRRTSVDRAQDWMIPLTLAVLGIMLWSRADQEHVGMVTAGYSLLAVFFGAFLIVVAGSAPSSLIAAIFNSRILCTFGKYSYGLYVYHFLLMPIVKRVLPVQALSRHIGSSGIALSIHVAGGITASMIVAYISWHAFEKRFLAMKRWFPYHLDV